MYKIKPAVKQFTDKVEKGKMKLQEQSLLKNVTDVFCREAILGVPIEVKGTQTHWGRMKGNVIE